METESTKDINAQIAEGAQDIKITADTEYYRFNLKMPMDYMAYLQAAAFRESSPTKRVTITEYICKMIAEDMDKHTGELSKKCEFCKADLRGRTTVQKYGNSYFCTNECLSEYLLQKTIEKGEVKTIIMPHTEGGEDYSQVEEFTAK